MRHSIEELINPTVALDKVSFGVCCWSFFVCLYSHASPPAGPVGRTGGIMIMVATQSGCHGGSPCRSGCLEGEAQTVLPVSIGRGGAALRRTADLIVCASGWVTPPPLVLVLLLKQHCIAFSHMISMNHPPNPAFAHGTFDTLMGSGYQ